MNDTMLTILIGILGTALGAFIPSLFNFLSKREEHKIFIKQFRAERSFTACEKLITHILSAELGEYVDHNSKLVYINHLLQHPKELILWHGAFMALWHDKRHLIDAKSFELCKSLNEFLYKFQTIPPDPNNPTIPPSSEQLVAVSEKFHLLLSASHKSLQEYLQHGIENS